MRSSFSVLGALIAASVLGVAAQDIPACVNTCSDQVRNERFGEIGCGSAGDAGCLCASDSFVFAIRDCSNPTCGGTEDQVRRYLQSSFCPNLAAAPAASAPADAAPPATTEAPPPAETSAPAPEPTSEAPQTTEAAPSTTEAPATSVAPQETSVSEAPSTTESSSAAVTTEPTTSSAETSAVPTSTGSPAADGDSDGSEKDDEDEDDDESEGLPQAAIIGIGVGIGAAVLSAVAVAFFLWRRRSAVRHKNRPVFEISKPLPGAGRAYNTPDHASFEKYGDIEMTTRYEEMVPRTQPRTML